MHHQVPASSPGLRAVDPGRARELFDRRGLVVLGPPALGRTLFDDLLREARQQRLAVSWRLSTGSGTPGLPQETVRAELGPRLRAFMGSAPVLSTLREVTGVALRPSFGATCLTYYERPGEFLGEHTDKQDTCTHAVLLYLDVRTASGVAQGTGLHVRTREGILVVTAVPNRVVVLHGPQLPHWRPPMLPGERVTLLSGCYAPARPVFGKSARAPS